MNENQTRPMATDAEKCIQMSKKYGWKLLRIEPTDNSLLKVDCVFEGKTEFPNYYEEN